MFTRFINDLNQAADDDERENIMIWWLEDLETDIINEFFAGLDTVTQQAMYKVEKILTEAVDDYLKGVN